MYIKTHLINNQALINYQNTAVFPTKWAGDGK